MLLGAKAFTQRWGVKNKHKLKAGQCLFDFQLEISTTK